MKLAVLQIILMLSFSILGQLPKTYDPFISEVGIAFEITTKKNNGNYSYVLDGIFVGK